MNNKELERSWLREDQLLLSLNKKWSEIERQLYTTKWFDYRFLTPEQATMEFAKEYDKVYRQHFATVIDKDSAIHINIKIDVDFSSVTKLPSAKISALWRARQFADSMCIPYNLFLTLAFKSALKYWRRGHMPQPQQLYSKRVIESVYAEWTERQASAIFVAADDRFSSQNYIGSTIQKAHIDWLLSQAKLRANEPYYIYQFIYERKLLPERVAKEILNADVFEKVRSYV